MKRMLVLCALFCLSVLGVRAQSIYNEVRKLMNSAEMLMNDTTKSLDVRKIACFKNDAIYYLIDRASKTDGFTEVKLGMEANAMIDFVNLYVKRLSEAKKKKEKDLVLLRFKNASLQYPLFNDPETEIVRGYVDNDGFITQFSIDTDWVKALAAVTQAGNP